MIPPLIALTSTVFAPLAAAVAGAMGIAVGVGAYEKISSKIITPEPAANKPAQPKTIDETETKLGQAMAAVKTTVAQGVEQVQVSIAEIKSTVSEMTPLTDLLSKTVDTAAETSVALSTDVIPQLSQLVEESEQKLGVATTQLAELNEKLAKKEGGAELQAEVQHLTTRLNEQAEAILQLQDIIKKLRTTNETQKQQIQALVQEAKRSSKSLEFFAKAAESSSPSAAPKTAPHSPGFF